MKELFLREAVFPPMGERRGYPFSIPALKNVDKIIFFAPVTFLAGENGAGKSTLLEALAVALGLNPEGGSQNFLFSTRDTHSALGESIRLVRGGQAPAEWVLPAGGELLQHRHQAGRIRRRNGRSSGAVRGIPS